MIKVNNLTKYYGSLVAIDDLSFEVEKGEILGFLGPNGAGKTTTLRILTTYLSPTKGEAEISGYDIFSEPLEVRKRIGYLPEDVPLYSDLRVEEYLSYRAKLKEIPKKLCKRKVEEVLEKCWIKDVSRRIIGQLSRGYKQRVGLASVLLHNPEVLILDEPTLGLDPHQIREVRKLIKSLGGEHTILLSSHILPEVEMVCGRVIIINKGKMVAMDTPGKLREHLKGATTINIEVKGGEKKIKELLQNIEAVSKVERKFKGEISCYKIECEKNKDPREKISQAIFENGGIIREMKTESVSLEDIFVQITKENNK